MKLGFDATSLTQAGKGLARFQADFLAELARLGLANDLTVFVTAEADPSLLPDAAGWRYVTVRAHPMVAWEQVGLPRAARAAQLDAVVTTSERAALWGPPRIVYIFEHPRHRAARDRETGAPSRQRLVNALTLALFPFSMRRAAAVLVASNATAADVERHARVDVVHAGVSAAFHPDGARATAAQERLGLPNGWLLHLASDDPRDNSEVVIEALARAAAAGARPALVLGGPIRALLDPLLALARERGVDSQVRMVGFATGQELADLYRGAIAYVDPSLYEGFGLQALEALACGTPAIASNRTSLPEVVGDAGILLDPDDADGFAKAILRLLGDDALRTELREKALRQAGRFTWERTVRRTLAACERINRA